TTLLLALSLCTRALGSAPSWANSNLPLPQTPHADFVDQIGDVRPAWRDQLKPLPPVEAPLPPSTNRAAVYGYHAYWGVDPTTLDFARLTHLAIFGVVLNTDGSLSYTSRWTDVAPTVVPLAHAAGTRVHVTLIAFSDAEQSAVLPSASRRATTIAALVALVEDYDGDGVNLDIEGLSSAYKDDLVTFTQELKAALPAGQDDVYLATPAVDWDGAFDYDQLCAAADGLFIMGYGFHWSGSNPGPISPLYGSSLWSDYALDWSVADYLAYGAWPDCIIMGLPIYGYEWPSSSPSTVPGTSSGTGSAVLMSSAVAIAADEGRQWDAITHTPYVIRSDSQLWYDDTDSLGDKIAWSMDQDLQGIGFWALGYEGDDPDFWDMVETETSLGDGGSSTDTGSAT
ncbi:MAG: hypothetical protein GXP62_17165, partial [Oligoflexia bacterium]|nr:hypothetical protein [Oligoflexia bacterium]